MKYQAWDTVSLGHGEPLVGFTKLFESDILNKVVRYIDDNVKEDGPVLMVTHENGGRLFDTTMSVYESPDGKAIYRRLPLSTNKTKIN